MRRELSFLGLSVITALFIGCGDGDLETKDLSYEQKNIFDEVVLRRVNYTNYNVVAVDDPIIGARVEANECNSSIENGEGNYTLQGCIAKPKFIAITGGVMVTKDGNITQSFPLLLNTQQTDEDDDFVVSPLTTIVSTIENPDELNSVAEKLGLTKDELFSDPRKIDNNDVNGSEVALKINNILIQATENGSVVNKVKFIDTVKNEIKNSDGSGSDLNFSQVAENTNKISQQNPDFFGFVMIPTNNDNDSGDILSDLHEMQHPDEINFIGFVFDKNFEANISIYTQDGTKIEDANVTTNEDGYWTIKDTNDILRNIIYDTNQTLVFEAVKKDDSSVLLKSVISTPRLRELIEQQKRVTATKENSLIISNVTTAEYALLDKRGVFNQENIENYENNLTNMKTYYNDDLLKASAVIKAVVDRNASLGNATNTVDLVTNAFNSNGDFNLSKTDINESITREMEINITQNSILKTQLNDISTPTIDENNKVTMLDVAQKANYTFYRLFAYKDDNGTGDLIREYEKFVLVPGGSEYYKYRLNQVADSNITEWEEVEYKEANVSNYNSGDFVITTDNGVIRISLDSNNSIYVEDLNKNYNYYNVIETDYEADGVTIDSRTPVIWVDDFDVVDGFRRLNDKDKQNLEDEVDGLTKEEVNSKLNKYVRDYINNVDSYFTDDKE